MILRLLAGLLKLPALFLIVFLFILTGFVGKLLIWNSKSKLIFFSKNTKIWTFFVLKILNFRIRIIHEEVLKNIQSGQRQNYLILSNHLSYLDILILSSLTPLLFITSIEMKNTFFLGQMSELGGSFFVERRNPAGIHQEIEKIAGILSEGFNVVLFPEGTTSNGEKVMPFKKSLLACAVDSNVPVLPVCLKYKKVNGKPVNPASGDLLYWYGNMAFFPHLLKLVFSCGSIHVEVHFLEKIECNPNLSPSFERKRITEQAHHLIEQEYFKH